jgi:hypothetical protein
MLKCYEEVFELFVHLCNSIFKTRKYIVNKILLLVPAINQRCIRKGCYRNRLLKHWTLNMTTLKILYCTFLILIYTVYFARVLQWIISFECSSEVLCARALVKSALANRDYGRRGSAALTMRHPTNQQKLALTSPTSGGCSVGIVRSRTKATELVIC